MFNERLSSEEAKELVNQRMKEAETFSLQKRLGYSDSSTGRWVFILIILIAALLVGWLL